MRRNVVVRVAQVVLVGSLFFAGTKHSEAETQEAQSNDQVRTWTISALVGDEQAPYGIERLAEALRAKGCRVSLSLQGKPPAVGNWLVVGCKGHPGLEELAEADDLARPELGCPEGFVISSQGAEGALRTLAIGADPSGAMYALLELAERVGLGQDFPSLYATKPDMELRYYAFYFPTEVFSVHDPGVTLMANRAGTIREAEFFYNKARMTELLDRLAEARINCLELNTAWVNWAAMVNLPDYPEVLASAMEAEPLTPEKMESQRIPYLRWFMAECKRRGIDTYVGFCLGMIPLAVAQAHPEAGPTPADPNPPAMDNYVRASVRALFETYPDLTGLNIFGMSFGGGDFWEDCNNKCFQSVVAGIKDARRKTKPKLILYQSMYPGHEEEIKGMLAEDVFSPYLSEMPHQEVASDPSVVGVFGPEFAPPFGAKGVAWICFGDYGSGDVTPYLWFSPQYLQAMISKLRDAGVSGATFYPIRGYYYPDYYERDWLYIKGIGRFTWDSSSDHLDYWVTLIRHHYGCSEEAARSILKAYTAAADIPTLYASQFHFGNCMYKPQFGAMLDEWMLNACREPEPQLVTNGLRVGVFKYFDLAEANQIPPQCVTPPQIVARLKEDAATAMTEIESARPSITRNREDFEDLRLNMHAWHYNGLHLAEKTQALLDMIQYARTGTLPYPQSGKMHLRRALDYYLQQVEVAKVLFPDADRDLVMSGDCVTVPHPLDFTVPFQKEEIEHYDEYLARVKQMVESKELPPTRSPAWKAVWYAGYLQGRLNEE